MDVLCHLCLSLLAVVRYNPAQMLGQALGQREGDGAQESID
jgi:hypothetical protein